MLSLLEHMYHELDLVKEFNINPITLKRWLVIFKNLIKFFKLISYLNFSFVFKQITETTRFITFDIASALPK